MTPAGIGTLVIFALRVYSLNVSYFGITPERRQNNYRHANLRRLVEDVFPVTNLFIVFRRLKWLQHRYQNGDGGEGDRLCPSIHGLFHKTQL